MSSSNQHLALITKTTSLIAAGDIVGAESALAELADSDGDGALMVVLDQLAPKDILAVMREYDDSKASVVNMLVTPCLLYTSPSPRDRQKSRMPSSA